MEVSMRRFSWLCFVAACSDPGSNHLPDAVPPACTPTGTPITHQGTISADETWASGIHEVTANVRVTGGTLTIAPCTEVRLAPDTSIELDATATAIVAEGSVTDPIRFVRDTADQPWGHISVVAPARASLAYATLQGGGTAGDYKTAQQLGATLVAHGTAAMLPAVLAVDHVTVDGSSGIGVFLDAARFVPGATALTVSNAGFYPVLLGADSATDLPDGDYTQNADAAILLQTTGTAAIYDQTRIVLADTTLHDRGVPYQVGAVAATIVVADGVAGHPAATLTIDPGVTLRFTPQGVTGTSRIQVRGVSTGVPQGALVAAGTTAQPIVFTSSAATPAAGDWQGLEFRGAVDPSTRIDHAVIEYAGGPSFAVGVCEWSPGTGNAKQDGAVIVGIADGQVPTEFVTNTAVSASAGVGVYRGWKATDVDFLATNTFTGIAGCLQTNVPSAANACPATACPVN
jgi:hypothetical protein